MTTTVTVEAHCQSNEQVVIVTTNIYQTIQGGGGGGGPTGGGTGGGEGLTTRNLMQDGERRQFYVYSGGTISISEESKK